MRVVENLLAQRNILTDCLTDSALGFGKFRKEIGSFRKRGMQKDNWQSKGNKIDVKYEDSERLNNCLLKLPKYIHTFAMLCGRTAEGFNPCSFIAYLLLSKGLTFSYCKIAYFAFF